MTGVFVACGSSPGLRPSYAAAAEALGRAIAAHGVPLVYGGGRRGLMGLVADSCMAAGGGVVGVIPRKLVEAERAHTGLPELIVVETMHERKQILFDRCDTVVALPGGVGTFDELFESMTWNQLDIHAKRVGLVNTEGYYDHMIRMLDTAQAEGFLYGDTRERVLVDDDPARLLGRLLGGDLPAAPAGGE